MVASHLSLAQEVNPIVSVLSSAIKADAPWERGDCRAFEPSGEGCASEYPVHDDFLPAPWGEGPIAQQAVAQSCWGHVTILLEKLSGQESREHG